MHKLNRRTYAVLIAGILIFFSVFKIVHIRSLNNGIDPNGDSYIEPSHLNSGRTFAEFGFLHNCGLPNFAGGPAKEGVYTHYPPGPDWIVGGMMKICGTQAIGCVRLFPLFFTVFSLAVFFWSLPLVFSLGGSLFLTAILMALPMVWFHAHGLAYWGYPFALLLLQIALILVAVSNRKVESCHWVLYALLTFTQGWFSFDFAFVSIFLPAPFALLFRDALPWKRWFGLIVLGGSMFTLAHLLHFLQNVCFFGGWSGAIQDYQQIAETRKSGKGVDVPWIKPWQLTFLNTLRLQLDVFLSRKQNFGHPAQVIFLLVGLLTVINFKRRISFLGRTVSFTFARKDSLSILAAFAIAALWCLVMTQHAYVHAWTARHFFLPYIVALMVLVRSTSISGRNDAID